MTHPHDDPTPVEHDPTGMRELLASLPDPGPMPEDLVARITAALAEESRAAQGSLTSQAARVVDAPLTALDAGNVVPLRPRRPTLRHFGVAAAVVTAIGLGGAALGAWPSSLTGPIAALSGSSSADSEAGAARAEAGAGESGEGADAGAGAGDLSADGRLDDVAIVMSGIDHDSSALPAAAAALVSATYAPVAPLTAESPGIGPIATAIGARTCADALEISPDAGILVDVSEVDGAPAAVLIATADGTRTAYAVSRSCTTGSPMLIAGPIALP